MTRTSISGKLLPTVDALTSNGSSTLLCVIPGEASVRPYTLVISRIYILSITSRINHSGHNEPAMIPVRKEERSNILNIGWFSSAINIVGTPYNAVHFSLCTEANTTRGSKRSSNTAQPPLVMMAIIPSTIPKQWKRGTGRQTRSFSVNFILCPMQYPLLVML